MKLQVLYFSFALIGGGFMLTSSAGGAANSQNKGYTGAPGDELVNPNTPKLCNSCHMGGSYNPTATIKLLDASNTPVTTYRVGQPYTVQFTITAGAGTPTGYGFQMIDIREADATNVKGFKPGEQPAGTILSILTNGRMYAEQNARSVSNTFNVKWQTNLAGKGAISFYAVGNAVNGNAGTGGDSPTASVKATFQEFTSATNELEKGITEFNLFPNPTANALSVKMNFKKDKICDVQLLDIAGKAVFKTKWALKAGENLQEMDLSAYPAGVYQLTLVSYNDFFTKKFCKW
ncbi:MAG: hypothetical protein RL329_2499 [Bacteroidota bacterium]